MVVIKIMYVIGVYDVNKKRVQKVLKIFRKYLTHIQESVFEGEISDKSLAKLNAQLAQVIDKKEDSIIFYRFHHKGVFNKVEIGCYLDRTVNII